MWPADLIRTSLVSGISRVAFGIVDRLKWVILVPHQELRRPGLEQGRQHLLSIAVFRRARERQPGSSDPGVGPRIEIFRNLRLACRTSERLYDGHATRGENIVPRRRSGHGRISEASDARLESAS